MGITKITAAIYAKQHLISCEPAAFSTAIQATAIGLTSSLRAIRCLIPCNLSSAVDVTADPQKTGYDAAVWPAEGHR